ncbi:unnamed protein product, partial [Rotaria socialis]
VRCRQTTALQLPDVVEHESQQHGLHHSPSCLFILPPLKF